MTRILCGADGCKAGWYAVSKDLDTGKLTWGGYRNEFELFYPQPAPEVFTVDIPIGLVDAGPRECDQAARRLLGPGRASSVFPAPIRPILAAETYREACKIRLEIDGKKISKQLWMILPKIRAVDALLRQDEGLRMRVREVHPELCFYTLAGGKPMQFWKKRPEGFAERLPLLQEHFGDALQQALAARRPAECDPDDVLDAFATLWTAERIARGQAATVPEDPPRDRFGLRMEMVM